MSKDVAVEIVTESLDNAILDMAKVKKSKSKKAATVAATTLPPENLFEVSEQVIGQVVEIDNSKVEIISHETVLATEPELLELPKVTKPRKTKALKKVESSKIVKSSKKASKINGFFGKKTKNVSRETLRNGVKTHKLTKSPYWTMSTGSKKTGVGGKLVGRMMNVYNMYKKNVMTGALAIMMLGFVTATTYVTYAYVTSGDADLIGKVAEHVILPESEQPKVYIIQSEKADLFSNPLFAGIRVGDNVLTYTNAGKVVIYRSSEDRIVNIVNLK